MAQPPTVYTSDHQLLCCKSIDKLICGRRRAGASSKEDARPLVAHCSGHRRHHRLGHFRPDRHRRSGRALRGSLHPARPGPGPDRQFPAHGQHCGSADARAPGGRPFDCHLVSAGGGGLQFCRPVLRGAGVDDSDRGQRLHLLVRHAGRNFCLDHRLGPDPGICGEQRGGGCRLQRIRQSATGGVRSQFAQRVGQPGLGFGTLDRFLFQRSRLPDRFYSDAVAGAGRDASRPGPTT